MSTPSQFPILPNAAAPAARFQNRPALVTGAAGGIGLAVSQALAREGALVAAVDLEAGPTAAGLHWFCADVSRAETMRELSEQVRQTLGDPAIVVHSAAVTAFLDTLSTPYEEFERIQRVNVFSAYLLLQEFAPAMKHRGSGAFVLIASITGIVGAPGMSAYSVSKGALITLARTAALELAEANVRVNCVCPASVDTPMLQASFHRHPDPALARELNRRRHPLGRLGTPEDVAHLVLFLASDEASWITGGTYVIDGGALLARRWKD
jgi:NAD(P)-dependent dehydrogenase (short-subunit alcohol dehydrogenase family)